MIFDTIIKGAARQFGAEFGRAGANSILKGRNAISTRRVSTPVEQATSSKMSWPKAILIGFLGWLLIREIFKFFQQ